MRILLPSALLLMIVLAAPAGAETWTIGPDRCPTPALAAPYAPETTVISPDVRDGVWPSARTEADLWPPAALAVRIPGGWPAIVWLDGGFVDSGAPARECAPVALGSQ